MKPFEIKKTNKNSVLHIILSGNLTMHNIIPVSDELRKISSESNNFQLNLASVESIDLTGIQLIYSFKRNLEKENKKIGLSLDLPLELNQLLKRNGFSDIIKN